MSLLSNPSSSLDTAEILSALFHPVPHARSPLPDNCTDIAVNVSEPDATLGCRLHDCGDKKAPLILYFHGNGETVSDYDDIGNYYNQAGFNILFTSYRGYGWSSGTPSVSTLLLDCLTMLDFCKTDLRAESFTGPIFVMGRSLGSVSAIECCYQRSEDITGLIIESGFAHTIPLLSRMGLDAALENLSEDECFNNVGKITNILTPTLILHGSRDHLIPVHEAEKLQAESGAKTKQFHMIPGADHNSLLLAGSEQYFTTIRNFTDTVTGQNTWRQRRKKFKQKE